jgi:hypothetical protein
MSKPYRKAFERVGVPEVFEQNLAPGSVELRESSKVYRKLAAKHHPIMEATTS